MFPGSLNTKQAAVHFLSPVSFVFIWCRLLQGGDCHLADDSHLKNLRSNIVLPPRLKGIEVVGSASSNIHSGQGSKPHTIDPPGVVIYSSQICLLNAIDP